MNKGWLIGALVGVALVASIGGLAYLLRETQAEPVPRLPPLEREDPEARRREIAAAFSKGGPLAKDEEARSIQALLDSLGAAITKADGQAIARHFDVERLYQEGIRQSSLDQLNRPHERSFIQGMRERMAQTLAKQAELMRWDRVQIKRIQFSNDRSEATVFARHWDDTGQVSTRRRWWMRKQGEQWRVYDLEELEGNLRLTTAMAMALTPRGLAPWARFSPQITQAKRAVFAEDYEEAGRVLKDLENVTFPAPVEGMLSMLRASVASARDEFEEALKHLDRAEALHPDFPMLHLLRSVLHNQMENYELAVQHGRKFIDLLGEDTDAYFQIGTALAALDRKAEAADAYRRGLDDYPDSIDNLTGLSQVLSVGRKAELNERLGRMNRLNEHFETLADNFMQEEDVEALEILVAAVRKRGSNGAAADALPFYEAEVHWLRDEYDAAVRILTKHRKAILTAAARRENFEDRLIRGLIRLKRAPDAVCEVEAAGKDTDFRLAAAAHASAGDVARTRAALERGLLEGYSLSDFYDDPDLGPLLRGDLFRALREEYPEPVKREVKPA